MRIIARRTIKEFWEVHRECEQQLKAWYREVKNAAWRTPRDVKLMYPSARILRDNRIVFNIRGNRYRLVVRVNYDIQIVWIRFVGTHAEYDNIEANEI